MVVVVDFVDPPGFSAAPPEAQPSAASSSAAPAMVILFNVNTILSFKVNGRELIQTYAAKT
jgi:hypothetical protein